MAARRRYTRTSYPARAAARRRAAAPKKRKPTKKSNDYTKWLLVGSAAVLAFFVFRGKDASASPRAAAPPPTSQATVARFIRAGKSGEGLKCFDTIQSNYVQDFFCDQQDDAPIDDNFFFPDELKG